jgi:hypothetical protein
MVSKKLCALTAILFLGASVAFACELVAFKGLDGINLSKSMYSGGDARRYFEFFKSLGFDHNTSLTQERNGFGMVFYLDNSGNHFAKWDGVDTGKNHVSTGVYFYTISTDNQRVIGKMVLVK